MADDADVLRVLMDYVRITGGHYEVGEVLYSLVDHLVDALGVDGAGVCLADADGRLEFVAASDQHVVTIERQQVAVAEGPCHDAHRDGQVVTVADLERHDAWPCYRPVALAEGCRAVAGIPLVSGDTCIGALNLYRSEPTDWDARDLEIASVLALTATGYIVNARTVAQAAQATQLSDQLQHALQSRVVIEQAKGILAERHGLVPAHAFTHLRAHARSSRTSIHAIAAAVVGGDLDIPPTGHVALR